MKKLLVAMLTFLVLVSGSQAFALDILLATGSNPDLEVRDRLTEFGHTVLLSNPATWDSSFDYNQFDVVALQFGSADPADIGHLVAAVDAGVVGVVMFRSYGHLNTSVALGLENGSATGDWQSGSVEIVNTDHPITSYNMAGPIDLGFTYKAEYFPGPDTTVLAAGSEGPTLVVHNTRMVIGVPFYGHPGGYSSETEESKELTRSALLWAAGYGSVATENTSLSSVKEMFR